MMFRLSNIVVSEPRWEIDEDRLISYDSGNIRMKNKNRGYGDEEREIELMEREREWLEIGELRSELQHPGKRRLIKMNSGQGNGREINNDADYISPRLRASAILKREIAIMESQYEIALLECESGRHEDNEDAGEVITQKEDNSMLQEIEFQNRIKKKMIPKEMR
ncbi:hypothetical protein HanXRQr2_Chr04g0188101 [Helianthus annuus]|uniref:Uncharacterized protein n=1 Tax=Helianthus annuus TaxID=4232 RepID=A0A9K3NTF9_HELAN|nr:hypothetical protein HanXRQr2_Chr04g0188101 [Helianthus annuus]KAJ0933154.1 hypothetical protein HanPSC8_Chr04g0181711 [Helianthus annuus]